MARIPDKTPDEKRLYRPHRRRFMDLLPQCHTTGPARQSEEGMIMNPAVDRSE
ncbi:hypothetical protein [Methanosphaerula subterraneus]|uniref:hypothetical protein n=1 Tax=Methanosphaerula subterraneus TaxID=3350244 RepID=UPI003F8653DF